MLGANKFSAQQLRSLHALKAHPGWPGFVELLEVEQTLTRKALEDTVDMAALYRFQGRAQVLRDLLHQADIVGDVLTKLGHTGL